MISPVKATELLGMGGEKGANIVQGVLGGELGTAGSVGSLAMSGLTSFATLKTVFGRGGGGILGRGGAGNMADAQSIFMRGGRAAKGAGFLRGVGGKASRQNVPWVMEAKAMGSI